MFSGKKPKKFKIKKPPRSSRSSKVSRPPELAKSSAGDDPNMDASDLNDEEIEVSAFLHDFGTCTANLNLPRVYRLICMLDFARKIASMVIYQFRILSVNSKKMHLRTYLI